MSNNLAIQLFKPVDNSPLVVFRIIFGLLLTAEAAGALFTGWVTEIFVEPAFTFTFIGFEWLRILNGPIMYGYYALMILLGILITIGWRYTVVMLAYAILWWGCYLMQKTHYNNHYYLMVLLCFIMVMLPAHRYFSLDVRRNPGLKSRTCPQWCLWLFTGLVSMVYVYAAIAKIYPDWLAGDPVSMWFARKTHYPIIGPLLAQPWMVWVVSYGGIAFDLLIAPLLLWRVTRPYAFIICVVFHLFNSAVFQIGGFPYLMIGFCVFFYPREKIRQIFFPKREPIPDDAPAQPEIRTREKWIMAALGIFFLIQLALPLRHHFFEGNVFWTEEGHRMSWRMMLRSKSGSVYFQVKDPDSGKEWKVRPKDHLSKGQARKVGKQPDMLWQFVQYLKEDFAEKGYPEVEIYAHTRIRLNKRPYQQLVDSTFNLAAVPWQPFSHAQWLVPLRENE